VKQRQAPVVRIDQRKRGAGYFVWINLETSGKSLHKDRLAGAEWSIEQQNLTAAKLRANLSAKIKGLTRVARSPFAR